jgi:site-specific recombinase XerD
MNPGDLLLHLEAYLALENALGFSLRARERLLRDFVAFVEANNTTGTISSQIALDWACSVSARCGVSGRAARLSVARRFLFHLSAMVPGIEVPSASLLARPQRSKPFLFSTEEISCLLNAALSIGAQASLQPHTLSTLLGLLVSSGLRANEALNLEVGDVLLDLDPPRLESAKPSLTNRGWFRFTKRSLTNCANMLSYAAVCTTTPYRITSSCLSKVVASVIRLYTALSRSW